MDRRKVRDIYGNWVYEDKEDDENDEDPKSESHSKDSPLKSHEDTGPILDWKDWVALIIASLQTILLPLVIFIVVVILLVALFFHV